MQRLAARGLRYAAVFAAGVFLAAAFFSNREPSVSSGVPIETKCTRSEADRDDIERSAAAIRRLALSCAACHGTSSDSVFDRRATLRQGKLDWFRPLLAESAWVAQCDRLVSMRRA
jgi:hypothetical protein